MRPLDTEQEGMSFETNRFSEDQLLMELDEDEAMSRQADEYLDSYGKEDSTETVQWMAENAVVPPPDSKITEAEGKVDHFMDTWERLDSK